MAIRVRGVVWIGTRTDAYTETVAFFREVLAIPLVEPRADFAWASMSDGSQLEVFGPTDHEHTDFATGPVPEFLVDDLAAALAELRERGVEIVGEPVLGTDEGWIHFRAPDGNIYGLTTGPQYRRP